MYRIINQDAIPRIIAGIRLAEKVLEEHPELAEDFAQCTSFKGISQQIDAFAHPTGLVWYLAGYNTKIKTPICESIPVNIKQYEYVKVRKDILDKLYAAIDEVTDMLRNGDDIAFGNIIEARDELEAGKRYSEVKLDRVYYHPPIERAPLSRDILDNSDVCKLASWVNDGVYNETTKELKMTGLRHKCPHCSEYIQLIRNWNDLHATGNCGKCGGAVKFRFNGGLSKL